MTRTKLCAAIAALALIGGGVVWAMDEAQIKWSEPEPLGNYRIDGLVVRPGQYAWNGQTPIKLDQAIIGAGKLKGDGPFIFLIQRPDGEGMCRSLYFENINTIDELPKLELMGGDVVKVWKKVVDN